MELALLKKIIDESDNPYLHYHAKRFEEIVLFVEAHFSPDAKILDVGNSPFAEILSKIFSCEVDEIGFAEDNSRSFGKQFRFDLNDSSDYSKWRKDLGPYDIIIFTEVIEHLYTSPNQVLNFLSSLLNEKGKMIIQTPNASVFHKRIQLLFGKNPYMQIREERNNPGHFREYTKTELLKYAKTSGFKVNKAYYANYFDYRYTHAQSNNGKVKNHLRLVNLFYKLLPPSFRPGITMLLSK